MKFHASPTQDHAHGGVVALKAESAPEGLLDTRNESIAQRKLNDMATGSRPVRQLMALNARASTSDRVVAQARLRSIVGGTAQLEPKEEELTKSMKRDPAQLKGEEEELTAGAPMPKLNPAQLQGGSPVPGAEEEIQTKRASPVQKKENDTGLPDQLKSGVESLSGMSMDHVKVHYNSDKPAQLNALAYAQGSDIHVGPGQEQHVPHEAWHVVQQAQGRVQPTTQMKEGTPVNTDPNLEAEADTMGAKAMQMRFGPTPGHRSSHK